MSAAVPAEMKKRAKKDFTPLITYRFELRTGCVTVLGLTQRFSDLDEATAAELRAIDRHAPRYNKHRVSSRGTIGYKAPPEVRERMKAARATREKPSMLGRKHSEATKELIRAKALGRPSAFKGRKHTPENIALMSAIRTRYHQQKGE